MMGMIDPGDRSSPTNQPGDGGFTNPRVFDTIEEAAAATTSEDDYLDGLDQPEGDEDEQN